MKTKLPDLVIGDLVINPPIVQGGMGMRISLSNLASAVANQGGVGTISGVLIGGVKSHCSEQDHINADVRELTDQIKKARANTNGVLAVNVMVALTNYEEVLVTAAEQGIDILFVGAGIHPNMPRLVEGTKAKLVPLVSSRRVADVICKSWKRKYNRLPDAIVLEGPLAGGHLGFTFEELESDDSMPLVETILPEVLDVAEKYGTEDGKKIPVIVGGGVYDGKDIARMIELGASGVQMATRFVATEECDADRRFKQAYVDCRKEDITIITSPVGMPGRAIRNEFLEKAKRGEIEFNCYYNCMKTCNPLTSPYCIAEALLNASVGNIDDGFVFAGTNAYRVDRITTVKELMNQLVEEAERELGLT
jgi:NAD(P)H-dependent flavin oxidoreductase YrpB (nitropropane dioxygenase family)